MNRNYKWDSIIRHILICIGIFLFTYFFRNPICNLLNKVIIDTFLKEFPTDKFSLSVLIVIALAFIGAFFKKVIVDKLYPALVSFITAATIFSVYFFVFRDNLFFHSVKINQNWDIRYSDLLFPGIVYVLLNFKSYRNLTNDVTKEKFVEDDAYNLINNDVLGRKGFAKHIAEIISNSTSTRAFAISVVGSWGSGKSVFMKFIESELDASNEIIHFNPWKVSDLKTIFEDFFSSLTSKVKKYDITAANDLKEYARHIIDIDDNLVSKIVNHSLKIFDKDISLSERFEKLNSLLKQTGKRYVVFIDDIDRLTGSEVIQVLKLIRNTADFGNIFFLVAIDYSYVVKSMSNTNEIALESQYLQKIFQFELILPPIKKDFIKENFKKIIEYDSMLPYDKEEMERTIDYLIFDRKDFVIHMFPGMKFEGNLEIGIDNLRDLIRFTNSFKISYKILKGEVDLHDLIMIELIKLRSIITYNLIGNFQILKEVENTTPKRVEIDYNKFKQLIGDFETDPELIRVKTLLDSLFTTPKKFVQTFRSINFPKNVEIYFHYQLFDQIPLKDFRDLRKKPVNEILLKIKAWEQEGKGAAIAQLLQEMRDFQNWDEFKKFAHLFLVLGESPKFREWLVYTYGYFASSETLVKMFSINNEPVVTKEIIEAFLDEIFVFDDISEYAKSEFASFFLEEYRRKENYQFKDKDYWLDKTNTALRNYLDKEYEFKPLIYELLFNSTDYVEPDSRKIVIDERAGKLVRDFIFKYPNSYLQFVLRPYYTPPNEIWTFDPFIDQIFTSFAEFEDLLMSSSSGDEMVLLAKKYLPQYKDKKEEREPIKVTSGDFQKLLKLKEEQNRKYVD